MKKARLHFFSGVGRRPARRRLALGVVLVVLVGAAFLVHPIILLFAWLWLATLGLALIRLGIHLTKLLGRQRG